MRYTIQSLIVSRSLGDYSDQDQQNLYGWRKACDAVAGIKWRESKDGLFEEKKVKVCQNQRLSMGSSGLGGDSEEER
jgi:hypothetical protein